MKIHPLLAALALAAASLQAQAVGRLADVSVLDRHTGAVLPTYYHRGEYWVAGTPGARYAIQVRNRRGERVLAVTAVDGVNVLTGDTAGWDQAGYVFNPSQAYQISGWRKSNAEVAAFEFSASPNSYAERTGRPAHVGVIGVALFLEKPAAPPPLAWPAPSAARETPAAEAERADSGARDLARQAPATAAAAAPAPKLGTAHGQRETSYVTQTEFVRQQSEPNELIRIRYDSRENLVALGVIRERLPQPLQPNPFPDSPTARFVPDPPAYR